MLYRKHIPSQSLVHGGDPGITYHIFTTYLIIVAFPDSSDCPGLPGEREGGWERGREKKKCRKKLSQSFWGLTVPLWSDFALHCSYAVFRNTTEASEFGHTMFDFLQEACLFRETMHTHRTSKLQEALFQGEPYFEHSRLHHPPQRRGILNATTQFVLLYSCALQ